MTDPTAAPLATSDPASLAGGAAGPASHRVLVVDDNIDAADTLATLLQLLGHDVRTAHDGPAGVRLADEFRPALILMDIGMPGMDGYEAARRIRAASAGGGVVMAALTGWGQEDDRRRSREAGFDYHFVKPADPEELQKLLAKL